MNEFRDTAQCLKTYIDAKIVYEIRQQAWLKLSFSWAADRAELNAAESALNLRTEIKPTGAHPAKSEPTIKHYDTEKPKARKYRLIDPVHPETVVRWFLDLVHYWFDETLGENVFTGQRDDAFRYLCSWIETGEFAPDNTLLEIQVRAKFAEWLGSFWRRVTAKCLAVRDGVDFAITERCMFDMGHDGKHSWVALNQFDPAIHTAQCHAIVPSAGAYEDIFCNRPVGHAGPHSGQKFESCEWVMIPGEKCTLPRDHEGPHGNETTTQPQQPEFDAAARRFWTPPEPLPAYQDPDELMKRPHRFRLDKTGGAVSNKYEICVCGFSKGNEIHPEEQVDIPKLHTILAEAAWKEQRIKDLAAAIHGHIAIKGAEPIVEGEDLDIVGGWIDELKKLWESM